MIERAEAVLSAGPQARFNDFFAHRMGLISHEVPFLMTHHPMAYDGVDSARKLEAGMVLSVETTMHHPRRGFIKIEDTVAVTASGYASGDSVSFYQGGGGVAPWRRAQRMGSRVRLGVEHLMASSAIPFVFPAQRIHREYFGDGSMRQLAPISPAVHLGAERVLVIGSGRMVEPAARHYHHAYPLLADVAGHVLSSIFLDSLSADIEQLERLNQILIRIPEDYCLKAGIDLRPITCFAIAPSERLDQLASRHRRSLPRAMRLLLGGLGATRQHGGALTSYLLFEQPYTRALLELGYEDAMQRRQELSDFLMV